MGLVFYSSYIPNEEKLFIGEDFLKQMLKDFKDSIICIGIQKGSTDLWIEIIEKYKSLGLDVYYDRIDDDLYVNSDVSGFQKALEIYCKKLDYKDFDGCVWFGHSKGVTSNNIGYHNFSMKYFWDRKLELENLLSNKEVGSYGFYLSVIPGYKDSKINDIWRNYTEYQFPHKSMGYMYTNTFFICKKEPFLNVFKSIKDNFFKEKLVGVGGEGDRYFFERDFIHFVDMQNLRPSFEELTSNNIWQNVNYNDYEQEIKLWKN
jgi:hypothetical protein